MVTDIDDYLDKTIKLSILEQDESQIGISTDEGWDQTEAALGYKSACSLFLKINEDSLTKAEKDQLIKAEDILYNLSQDAQIIREASITKYINENDNLDSKNVESLRTLANNQYKKLITNGEVYLNYGYAPSFIENNSNSIGFSPGHAEVMKISFTGDEKNGEGRYSISIYNAGDETDFVNSKKNSVKARRYYDASFYSKEEAISFIELVNERVIGGVTDIKFSTITQLINSKLNETSYISDKGQTKGNCTTRSLREALKDILEPNLFSKFYNLVSNRPILEQRVGEYLIQNQKEARPSPFNIKKAIFQSAIMQGGTNFPEEIPIDILLEQFKYGNGEKGTLLHYAIATGKATLFGDLIFKYGMDGTEKNQQGYSALEYAITKNSEAAIELIKYLKEQGKQDSLEKTNIIW